MLVSVAMVVLRGMGAGPMHNLPLFAAGLRAVHGGVNVVVQWLKMWCVFIRCNLE